MKRVICHEIGKDAYFKIWHATDPHMIIYMNSDGGSIVCSEKTYPISKGVLCFIGAGKYHYTMPDEPEIYDRSKLYIPEKMLEQFSENGFLKKFSNEALIYAIIPEEKRDEVERLFYEIEETEEDPQYKDALFLSSAMKLLVLLDQHSLESTQQTTGFINKAVEYISDHIFQELTIDEICSAIHISKYHFCRTFRTTMNMTVMDYILKTRIVMAEGMLRKDRFSVSEISEKCGFSSISYFCRVFKEENGLTPLGYRRKYQ